MHFIKAILVTIIVMVAAGFFVVFLSPFFGEATPWLLLLAASLWVLLDAQRIELDKYEIKNGARTPVTFFICCLLLWVVAFPWYLYYRSKILAGEMEYKLEFAEYGAGPHTVRQSNVHAQGRADVQHPVSQTVNMSPNPPSPSPAGNGSAPRNGMTPPPPPPPMKTSTAPAAQSPQEGVRLPEQISGNPHDILDYIDRLADMRDKGTLSDEEFLNYKNQLMGATR